MPRYPNPQVLANHLRAVARLLDDQGRQAITMAKTLQAHGYPASTLGDGGSRGSDETSTTERAALNPNEYAGIHDDLAKALRVSWGATLKVQSLMTRVLAHAGDDDLVPAGTGSCEACGRVWRPTARKPEDRIKSGFGPCCYMPWIRDGRPDRSSWARLRRLERTA